MKRAFLLVLLMAANVAKTCGQSLSVYDQVEVDQQIDNKIQELKNQMTLEQMAQRLRDHPEEAPAAVAARIASHPEIVAQARADWVVQWNKDHPFSTTFDRPAAPDDYLDKAIRQSEAQKQPDLDSRIASLEAKITQLEQQRSPARRVPANTEGPRYNLATQNVTVPTPLPKPNPASVMMRTLPDGRVMAIVGSETLYYKNSVEAKAAIDKIRKGLSTPPAPAK
jgi:hypothetical protein